MQVAHDPLGDLVEVVPTELPPSLSRERGADVLRVIPALRLRRRLTTSSTPQFPIWKLKRRTIQVDADAKNSNPAAIPVEAMILDPAEVPVYLRIAEMTRRLRELGLSDKAIARSLGVGDKTVSTAGPGS